MEIDMGKISELLNYAYDSYGNQKDDPSKNIDWLENIIDGVYIKEDEESMWIVFRGTDKNKDSDKVNFRLLGHRLPYVGVNPKIWVHTGLIDLYDRPECRGVIHKKVAMALNKNLNIWVLGHSQGGGMAQICAVDLHHKFEDRIEDKLFVVPVAPMRAGNKHFTKSYERRIKNSLILWKGADWVPHIPFGFVGYKLPGKLLQVNKRDFFSKIWNFISAPVVFIFKGRKKPSNNPTGFVSFLTILSAGPDWYFSNDHSADDWMSFVVKIEDLEPKKKCYIKVGENK